MSPQNQPTWLYHEFQHTGVNYGNAEVARQFEWRHRSFRDFDLEFQRIKERVDLKRSDVVLDLGCGSGAFVVPAAKYCRKVYGADVSKTMLALLQEKLDAQGLKNVELFNDGFLSYSHDREPLDVVVSSIALHHIPDFWKAVALQKIVDALKPNGKLYLLDVFFNFSVSDWRNGTQKLLDDMSEAAGGEANVHVSSEYSTFNWIIEGMFERVGLEVEQTFDDATFLRAYVCRKSKPFRQDYQTAITREASRSIDAEAVRLWGIPSLLLMENAGRSLADIFMANATRLDNDQKPRRILICCGKGNNGGDGFVMARRLSLLGLDCRVIAFGRLDEYSGDALTNLNIFKASTKDSPEKLFFFDQSQVSLNQLANELAWCDWIVDALLGTGAVGPLRNPYDQIVPLLNQSGKPIFSIDVPSGLSADDGSVYTDAVKAKLTVALAVSKIGLTLECAKRYVGELHIGDIGIPIKPFIDNN
jgi:hydroxyethylthiazole kinase-like uncharacterized protein yjeF